MTDGLHNLPPAIEPQDYHYLETGKLPPQAVDLEEAVLGAIMLEREVMLEVVDILEVESFYKEAHQYIYKACLHLYEDNSVIDILTVTEQLKRYGKLDFVGGPFYISQLTSRVASGANSEYHAAIIKQKHVKRSQITLGNDLVRQGYNETVDAFDTNDYASNGAFSLHSMMDLSKTETNIETIRKLKEQSETAGTAEGITGIPSGISAVDNHMGGKVSPDFIILAARPGMGKTSKALCELRHTVVVEKKTALVFSLEMTRIQLMAKLIAVDAGIPLRHIIKGDMNEEEWTLFHESAARFETERLVIVDDIYSINGIVNKCKTVKLKQGLDEVFIDYLQLIHSNLKGAKHNREQEISYISRTIKQLAKNLGVPITALSQLSRTVETRGGSKRPMLSDLRESGSLEQDADIVAFLYRPEYYGIEQDEEGMMVPPGYTEYIIAKFRNGQPDSIGIKWESKYTKFTDLDETDTFKRFDPIAPNEDFGENNNGQDEIPDDVPF